jgi:HAD superfamily hydrolase (TIGR01549 family)
VKGIHGMDRDYDPRKIKGVFFDLYGTIFIYGDMDSAWGAWFDATYAGLKTHGLTMDEESFDEECDGFFSRDFTAGTTKRPRTVYEARTENLCRRLGLKLKAAEITAVAEAGLAAWHRYLHFDEKIFGVLKALKGEKVLALISNFDHPPHIERLMGEYALDRFFEHVIVSSAVGVWKPDPRIFRLALEKTGLQPDQVLYVGDSEKDDVAGARAAGIYPLLIRRGHKPVRLDYTRRLPQAAARQAAQPLAVISELTGIFKYL